MPKEVHLGPAILDVHKLDAMDHDYDKTPFQRMQMGMEHLLDAYMPGWHKDPSMKDTAKRFCKYLKEYATPLDMEKIFGTTFSLSKDETPPAEEACSETEGPAESVEIVAAGEGIVVQTNIPFRAVCEHHLLPMHGRASVGYVPNEKLLGLSKFVRLVQGVGLERPSLQEHIGNRIAHLMEENLQPKGVAVIISSEHTCMSCRGVASPDVVTVSSALRGVFFTNPAARQELMSLIKHHT